jgi:predicted component of type VI protein secretion system
LVVDRLFKETAQLESQAYELQQRTALAAEAKTVLDSWVRYESQVKQRQQRELAESVIAKIQKELENPKILQQILQQSVADVERKLSTQLYTWIILTLCRHPGVQGPVNGYQRLTAFGIVYKTIRAICICRVRPCNTI